VDLKARVEGFVRQHRLVSPGMRVLVAVSGGPDSVALLDVLYRLRQTLDISLTVAHLNHRLRGEEADNDARYVRELAQRYGLPCILEEFDVAAYRQRHRLSTQLAAREIRYRFFIRAARETGAARVALGHQADDQAETILHRFLRGAGPAGLAGMPPLRPPFIRPLLPLRRRDIEFYCRERGLNPRYDASNLDPVYTRNRLRHRLMPLLEAEYNPNLVTNLLRLGEICRADNACLDELAAKAFRRVARRINGRIDLDATALVRLAPALGRRVVRLAWSELAPARPALDFDHVERVLTLAAQTAGGRRLDLPGGFTAAKQAGRVVLGPRSVPPPAKPWCYELRIPGRTQLPAVNRSITAEIRPAKDISLLKLGPGYAVLDIDALSFPLYVRNRRPGDVFAPQGAGGRMKLKEFLINCKVPRTERDRIPLVFDREGRLAWVVGYRIADFCKLGPASRTALLLHVSPTGAGRFELC
jgi:tRNA(Ile)-lysidine synthase